MTGVGGENWTEQNQRYLKCAVTRVWDALQRSLARENAAPERTVEDDEIQKPAAADMAFPPALLTLCQTFGLSPFERDVLLLCAGVELDARFSRLCAAVQEDPQRGYVTFSLALAALSGAHWSAFAPDAPLRHWQLLYIGVGNVLTLSPLRIDERILNYLLGVPHLDARLTGLVTWKRPGCDPVPSQQALIRQIIEAWSRPPRPDTLPVIHLHGVDPAERQNIASVVCQRLGLKLGVVHSMTLPTAQSELDMLLRLWERDAALDPSALLLECADQETGDSNRSAAVMRFVERSNSAIFLSSREHRHLAGRPAATFEVRRPTTDEQWRLWRRTPTFATTESDARIARIVSQFDLSATAIEEASARLNVSGADAGAKDEDNVLQEVWDACRAHARPRLQDLAQPIETRVTWDDLVLPDLQRQILRDIAVHVRQRYKVYETWGFGASGTRGLGISALFAGSSGTGKTMAAEVLANELRLDLVRIDLSSVVSKYIGETEKNLRRVFDSAESGGAILLFDEADALFGKRSDVKDSHDRYANIEVSYLLQRMECYRGLAILTTNLRSALDTAFLRRLRFIVQFPFPDAAQREAIWSRVFPPDTPTEGLDAKKLARLNLAGGNIRNIAVNAAFLAADAEEPVRMKHLLRSARVEYAKLEKPLTDVETAGWLNEST